MSLVSKRSSIKILALCVAPTQGTSGISARKDLCTVQSLVSGEEASTARFLNLSENLWITLRPS